VGHTIGFQFIFSTLGALPTRRSGQWPFQSKEVKPATINEGVNGKPQNPYRPLVGPIRDFAPSGNGLLKLHQGGCPGGVKDTFLSQPA
jgi:hypothetical protein